MAGELLVVTTQCGIYGVRKVRRATRSCREKVKKDFNSFDFLESIRGTEYAV